MSIRVLVALGVGIATATAADYHVAADGDDGAEGSAAAPFATVAHALSESGAGDVIRLRRGDVFREGELSIGGGRTLAAYGSGALPALHGSVRVSGWSRWAEDAAVSVASVATGGAEVVAVYLDGERLTLARYPDAGWLRVDEGSGDDRIVDAALAAHPEAAAGRWVGAQVRWRKWSWWHETRPITVDDGAGTLSLGGSSFANHTGIDSGYYIDDDIDELDAPGEWFWDGSKLYVYPPAGVDLAAATVEAAFRTRAATVSGATISEIAIRHYAAEGLRLNNRPSTIERCVLEDLSVDGIVGTWNAFGSRIVDCVLRDVLNNGIVWNEDPGAAGGTVIEGNVLERIGTVPGLDEQGSWSGVGILISNGNAVAVRRNRIDGTGYAGILFGSDGLIAERNVLIGCMATENDGAAIYCNANANVIRENIIVAVEGDLESSHPWTPLGHGIWVEFLSEFSDSVIEHNTVYGCGGAGLFLDNNFDCTIANNRFVSNQTGGIRLGARDGASAVDHGHTFTGNVLAIGAVPFAASEPRNLASWADTTDRCLSFEPLDGNDRDIDYGAMGGTDFLTPSGDDYVRVSRWEPTVSIAEWQDQEGDWADPAPRVQVGDGHLFANDSTAMVDWDLPPGVTWQHLDGSAAGTSVELAPFRSVLLIAAAGDASAVSGLVLYSQERAAARRSVIVATGAVVDGWSIESDDPGPALPAPVDTDPATFNGLDATRAHRLAPVVTDPG